MVALEGSSYILVSWYNFSLFEVVSAGEWWLSSAGNICNESFLRATFSGRSTELNKVFTWFQITSLNWVGIIRLLTVFWLSKRECLNETCKIINIAAKWFCIWVIAQHVSFSALEVNLEKYSENRQIESIQWHVPRTDTKTLCRTYYGLLYSAFSYYFGYLIFF